MPSPDLSALSTPSACTADFCLIPIGTPTASVSREVAEAAHWVSFTACPPRPRGASSEAVRLTVLLASEGSWDEVMRVIGQAHALLHKNGVVRIQSDIRVGTRTDKKQSFEDKVTAVEKLLAADQEKPT
ncbi:UPF0045 protein M15 [Botryosphaeria dothidea]